MSSHRTRRLSWITVPLLLLGTANLKADFQVLTSRPQPSVTKPKLTPVGTTLRTKAGERQRIRLPDGSLLYVNEKTAFTLKAPRRLSLTQGEIYAEVAQSNARDERDFVIETDNRTFTTTNSGIAVRISKDGPNAIVTRGEVKVNGIRNSINAGQQLKGQSEKPSRAPRASHALTWTRELHVQAQSPLVPRSSYEGGNLVVKRNGQEQNLDLRRYHVDVQIEDGFARTTIDQTYFNQTENREEGTFYFPLPADASLSRLAMYVDGTRMEGGMVERDEGRAIYQNIVDSQRDPALLEWLDGTTFRMRVFPLEARQEKRIILSYVQRLPTNYSQTSYRFPMRHSLTDVGKFSFEARVINGTKENITWNSPDLPLTAQKRDGNLVLTTSLDNAKLDRDVVLNLNSSEAQKPVRFSAFEQDKYRYLMMRFRPNLSGSMERKSRDWVILFETSADRNPLLARAQIEIIRSVLNNADLNDRFIVLTANTRVKQWKNQLQSVSNDNINEAMRFLENAHLIGALDVKQALSKANEIAQDFQNPYLLHVGGGTAAMGERDVADLVKVISDKTRYVGVGVGHRWNRSLMKAAAEKTGGYFTQINPNEPLNWRGFELAMTLDSPRLLGIQITSDNDKLQHHAFQRTLIDGEELCSIVRLNKSDPLPKSIKVEGTLNGEQFSQRAEVKEVNRQASYLPRLWTRLEIERLLVEDAQKNKKMITELSMDMHVMSPFTSMLVLETEAMYQQYKVNRTRKVHWARYDSPEKIKVVYEPLPGMPRDRKAKGKPTAEDVLETLVLPPRNVPISGEFSGIVFSNTTPEVFGPNGSSRVTDRERVLRLFERGGRTDSRTPIYIQQQSLDYVLAPATVELSRYGTLMRSPGNAFRNLGDDNFNTITAGVTMNAPIRSRNDAITDLGSAVPQLKFVNGSSLLGSQPRSGPLEELDFILDVSGFTPEGRRLALNNPKMFAPAARGSLPRRVYSNRQGPPSKSLFLNVLFNEQVQKQLNDQQLLRFGINRLISSNQSLNLTYQRSNVRVQPSAFFNLVSYAPGMRMTLEDVQAVLEAEAKPSVRIRPGTVDEKARDLFTTARALGWHQWSVPTGKKGESIQITFQGAGQFRYERKLTAGLREIVSSDGNEQLTLYPDLSIGARRSLSRFHRLALSQQIPFLLPLPEDLAFGADLKRIDNTTVALIPHRSDEQKNDKKQKRSEIRFVFSDKGQFRERQIVEMPGAKILARMVCEPEGEVKLLDEKGKAVVTIKGTLRRAAPPKLNENLKELVLLNLPYRSVAYLNEKLKDKSPGELSNSEALEKFASLITSNRPADASRLFRDRFHTRNQRQLGFYVLLASIGLPLTDDALDVMEEHPDSALAQYLSLHSSPTLRKHAAQWAIRSGSFKEGFLGELAQLHALHQRWQSTRVLSKDKRAKELPRASEYVRQNKGTTFGWIILCDLQNRANELENEKQDVRAINRELAKLFELFTDSPGFAYDAKYENARALLKSGQREQARQKFVQLWQSTIKEGGFPIIDSDFRTALLGEGEEENLWSSTLQQTAERFMKEKKLFQASLLVRQCNQVGDTTRANAMLSQLLEKSRELKQVLPTQLSALDYLLSTGQITDADALLQTLLKDATLNEEPALWRLAASTLGRQEDGNLARKIEYLEKVLALDYENRDRGINFKEVSRDYYSLLNHYAEVSNVLKSLRQAPPEDFLKKVVRTADRWRALSKEQDYACSTAAKILQQCGRPDLAWDYLTTPVGIRPHDADQWETLATTLIGRGDRQLADRAYASAFAIESTNAEVLWNRARNLQKMGRLTEAKQLMRQVAEGTWPNRYRQVQSEARWQLRNR